MKSSGARPGLSGLSAAAIRLAGHTCFMLRLQSVFSMQSGMGRGALAVQGSGGQADTATGCQGCEL